MDKITWAVRTNLGKELLPQAGTWFENKSIAEDVFEQASNMLSTPGEYVTLHRRKKTSWTTYTDAYRTWMIGKDGKLIKLSSVAPKTVEEAEARRAKQAGRVARAKAKAEAKRKYPEDWYEHIEES